MSDRDLNRIVLFGIYTLSMNYLCPLKVKKIMAELFYALLKLLVSDVF